MSFFNSRVLKLTPFIILCIIQMCLLIFLTNISFEIYKENQIKESFFQQDIYKEKLELNNLIKILEQKIKDLEKEIENLHKYYQNEIRKLKEKITELNNSKINVSFMSLHECIRNDSNYLNDKIKILDLKYRVVFNDDINKVSLVYDVLGDGRELIHEITTVYYSLYGTRLVDVKQPYIERVKIWDSQARYTGIHWVKWSLNEKGGIKELEEGELNSSLLAGGYKRWTNDLSISYQEPFKQIFYNFYGEKIREIETDL